MSDDPKEPKGAWKSFTEEIEVAGHQLINEVNRLIAEGNVRKLVIKSETGDVFVSLPLTGGAVAGGIAMLAAPWLVIIAAVAGLVVKAKIEVVRDQGPAKELKDGSDDD